MDWQLVVSYFTVKSMDFFYSAEKQKTLTTSILAGDQSWPFCITLLYLVTETLSLVILRV